VKDRYGFTEEASDQFHEEEPTVILTPAECGRLFRDPRVKPYGFGKLLLTGWLAEAGSPYRREINTDQWSLQLANSRYILWIDLRYVPVREDASGRFTRRSVAEAQSKRFGRW
jgi:hypothetical protein